MRRASSSRNGACLCLEPDGSSIETSLDVATALVAARTTTPPPPPLRVEMPLNLKLGSLEEQRELFLWKFTDVDRQDVYALEKDFLKHDIKKCGELDEHEAAMLLEHRNNTKTASEIRQLLANIDKDKNHKVSFIEWACAIFEKPFDELNNFADEEARQKAMDEAKAAGEKARAAEEEIARAKEAEEAKMAQLAKELEDEAKLTGVAGMSAFFKRQADNTKDSTVSNEQKVKEEAARRKVLREAKKQLSDAVEAAGKQRRASEVEREIRAITEAKTAEDAAVAAKAAEDEKAARQARKDAMNAKWQAPK